MKESPMVSILLLSMNHEKLIENCINSLNVQTYKNIEIIYLDNVSQDKTFDIAQKILSQSDFPTKIFRNTESKGISKNFNFLLSESSGKYIIPLSTDDWLTPDSVSEKVKYLTDKPNYGMVYSSVYKYYYDTGEKSITEKKSRMKEGWILDNVLKENCIITTGCMIRKSVLLSVGNWDENSLLEDWDMWIRIAQKFQIGAIKKELAYYGIKSATNITGNFDYMSKGFDYILEKYAHLKKINRAKRLVAKVKSYHFAQTPSISSLKFILRNFRFNIFYCKQVAKVCIGIAKNNMSHN